MEDIKLVIKIPDQIYLNAKTDTLCGADILVSAIKNGIPHETVTEFADRCRECGREKVLDKIRAEIKAMSTSHCGGYIGLDKQEVLKVIDKYKAERRGE